MSRLPRQPVQSDASTADDSLRCEFVGASEPFLKFLTQLRRLACSEAPVLLEGETGSGKELAARAIHYWGLRNAGPFVPVNCGALPDNLIETELFGHERGAFTDARLARRGLVAEANGGTLFLDEVDTLSNRAQIALLRFLQDQRYRPLGSSRELRTSVRVIAATNQPLAIATQQGRFRCDLMYRLHILHLALPPLRSRTGDAERLARHFVQMLCARHGLPVKSFDEPTLAWIRSYHWPGNVRELENWVHRHLLMADGDTIRATQEDASESGSGEHPIGIGPGIDTFQHAKAEAVRLFERNYVLNALRRAGGNVTHAAQLAGKERRAFGKLLKKHGIDRQSPAI